MKVCSKCGKKRIETSFYIRKESGKRRRDCKFCIREHVKEYHKNNIRTNTKKRKDKWKRTPNGIMSRYKENSIKKNRLFALTTEWFNDLINAKCHYCGIPLRTHINPPGVDRKDSSIGYTEENSVPCCWTCNRMKQDLKYEDFIKQCKIIARRIK